MLATILVPLALLTANTPSPPPDLSLVVEVLREAHPVVVEPGTEAEFLDAFARSTAAHDLGNVDAVALSIANLVEDGHYVPAQIQSVLLHDLLVNDALALASEPGAGSPLGILVTNAVAQCAHSFGGLYLFLRDRPTDQAQLHHVTDSIFSCREDVVALQNLIAR